MNFILIKPSSFLSNKKICVNLFHIDLFLLILALKMDGLRWVDAYIDK